MARQYYQSLILRKILWVAILLSRAQAGWAQMAPDPVKRLQDHVKGQGWRLRHLVTNSKIRYDEAGKLLGKYEPGMWTLHGHVEVRSVELKDGVLKIKGNRLALTYNEGTHRFRPIRHSEIVNIEIAVSTGDKTLDLSVYLIIDVSFNIGR